MLISPHFSIARAHLFAMDLCYSIVWLSLRTFLFLNSCHPLLGLEKMRKSVAELKTET